MQTRYGTPVLSMFLGAVFAWVISEADGNKWFYLLPGFFIAAAVLLLFGMRDYPPAKI